MEKIVTFILIFLMPFNSIAWAIDEHMPLAASSIFSRLSTDQIRDMKLIKFYLMSIALTLNDLDKVTGTISVDLREADEIDADSLKLEFDPDMGLIGNNTFTPDMKIVKAELGGSVYYACMSKNGAGTDIPVFTADEIEGAGNAVPVRHDPGAQDVKLDMSKLPKTVLHGESVLELAEIDRPSMIVKFLPKDPSLVKFQKTEEGSILEASFEAESREGDETRIITLAARKTPVHLKDIFRKYKRTGIQEIDGALDAFLEKFDGDVLLLEPNEYGVNGFGGKKLLAVSAALKYNGIALFHVLAQASGLDLRAHISGGKECLESYLDAKARRYCVGGIGKEEWKEKWRGHYALGLFQSQAWVNEDARLGRIVRFIDRYGREDRLDIELNELQALGLPTHMSPKIKGTGTVDIYEKHSDNLLQRFSKNEDVFDQAVWDRMADFGEVTVVTNVYSAGNIFHGFTWLYLGKQYAQRMVEADLKDGFIMAVRVMRENPLMGVEKEYILTRFIDEATGKLVHTQECEIGELKKETLEELARKYPRLTVKGVRIKSDGRLQFAGVRGHFKEDAGALVEIKMLDGAIDSVIIFKKELDEYPAEFEKPCEVISKEVHFARFEDHNTGKTIVSWPNRYYEYPESGSKELKASTGKIQNETMVEYGKTYGRMDLKNFVHFGKRLSVAGIKGADFGWCKGRLLEAEVRAGFGDELFFAEVRVMEKGAWRDSGKDAAGLSGAPVEKSYADRFKSVDSRVIYSQLIDKASGKIVDTFPGNKFNNGEKGFQLDEDFRSGIMPERLAETLRAYPRLLLINVWLSNQGVLKLAGNRMKFTKYANRLAEVDIEMGYYDNVEPAIVKVWVMKKDVWIDPNDDDLMEIMESLSPGDHKDAPGFKASLLKKLQHDKKNYNLVYSTSASGGVTISAFKANVWAEKFRRSVEEEVDVNYISADVDKELIYPGKEGGAGKLEHEARTKPEPLTVKIHTFRRDLTGDRFQEIVRKYPRNKVFTQLDGKGNLAFGGFKPRPVGGKVANYPVEVETDNGEIDLIKFIWEENGKKKKERVPPGIGARIKGGFFAREIAFVEKLSSGLQANGLDKITADNASSTLAGLYQGSLDLLEKYGFLTPGMKNGVRDLDIEMIDLPALAKKITEINRGYKSKGFTDQQIEFVIKNTLFPVAFYDYMDRTYRFGNDKALVNMFLSKPDCESFIKQRKELEISRGTLDRDKHLKPYDPNSPRLVLLDNAARAELYSKLIAYRNILERLGKEAASNTVEFTGVGRYEEHVDGEGVLYSMDIKTSHLNREIKAGDILFLEEDQSVALNVVGVSRDKIIVGADEQIDFREKTGRLVHSGFDVTSEKQLEILSEVIRNMVRTGYTSTGYKVLDRILKLSKDNEVTDIDEALAERKIKFFSKDIPRRVEREGQVDVMKGDESQEVAVKMSMGGAKLKIIHGPGGTGKTTVIKELIQQYVEQGKKVLLVSEMNQAVDNALKDVMDDVPALRFGNSVDSFRYGTEKVWAHYRDAVDNFHMMREKIKKRTGSESGLLFASTNISISTDKMAKRFLRQKDFDVVIMDESSRETLTGAMVPLQYLKDDGIAVIVGDTKQLKPHRTVTGDALLNGIEPAMIDQFFGSILAGMEDQGIADEVQLSTNWRSHPLIAKMVSKLCYGGDIHQRGLEDFDAETLRLRIEDIMEEDNGFYEEKSMAGGNISLINRRSARKTLEIVKDWRRKDIQTKDITIVTPYRGQKHILTEMLAEEGFGGNNMPQVVTIDSYQGGENENIILDIVRSNDDGEIGFLKDIEKLTVAFSRARKNLSIIMDTRVFLKDIDDVKPEDRPARKIFLELMEFYLDEIWQFFPDKLPGNAAIQTKVKVLLRQKASPVNGANGAVNGAALMGKYMPVNGGGIKFDRVPDSAEYAAEYVGEKMGMDGIETLNLKANPPPGSLKNIFRKYKRTGIRDIDEALSRFLDEYKGNILLLETNDRNIFGIGDDETLAVAAALKYNEIALFHELAHAAKLDLTRYIDGGSTRVEQYLEEKAVKYNIPAHQKEIWKDKWRAHYVLRLFQEQKWPEEDLRLTGIIKFLSFHGAAGRPEVQLEALKRLGLPPHLSKVIGRKAIIDVYELHSEELIRRYLKGIPDEENIGDFDDVTVVTKVPKSGKVLAGHIQLTIGREFKGRVVEVDFKEGFPVAYRIQRENPLDGIEEEALLTRFIDENTGKIVLTYDGKRGSLQKGKLEELGGRYPRLIIKNHFLKEDGKIRLARDRGIFPEDAGALVEMVLVEGHIERIKIFKKHIRSDPGKVEDETLIISKDVHFARAEDGVTRETLLSWPDRYYAYRDSGERTVNEYSGGVTGGTYRALAERRPLIVVRNFMLFGKELMVFGVNGGDYASYRHHLLEVEIKAGVEDVRVKKKDAAPEDADKVTVSEKKPMFSRVKIFGKELERDDTKDHVGRPALKPKVIASDNIYDHLVGMVIYSHYIDESSGNIIGCGQGMRFISAGGALQKDETFKSVITKNRLLPLIRKYPRIKIKNFWLSGDGTLKIITFQAQYEKFPRRRVEVSLARGYDDDIKAAVTGVDIMKADSDMPLEYDELIEVMDNTDDGPVTRTGVNKSTWKEPLTPISFKKRLLRALGGGSRYAGMVSRVKAIRETMTIGRFKEAVKKARKEKTLERHDEYSQVIAEVPEKSLFPENDTAPERSIPAIIHSWFANLRTSRYEAMAEKYPRHEVLTTIDDGGTLAFGGRSYFMGNNVAGYKVRVFVEDGNIALVKFIWGKPGKESINRVPPGFGLRSKKTLFKKEIEFIDNVAKGLAENGLEKERSELAASTLARLHGGSLELLAEYGLLSRKLISGIQELDYGGIENEMRGLAGRIISDIGKYESAGLSERMINAILKKKLYPFTFYEYMDRAYKISEDYSLLNLLVFCPDGEGYVMGKRFFESQRGTLDKEKHLKIYDPGSADQGLLNEDQRESLFNTLLDYDRVLDDLADRSELNTIPFTKFNKNRSGPDHEKYEYRYEFIVPGGGPNRGIKAGDFLYMEDAPSLTLTVIAAENGRIVVDANSGLEAFSGSGRLIHSSFDVTSRVQKDMLGKVIKNMRESGNATTGYRVLDILLKLAKDENKTDLGSNREERAVKFYSKDIPRREKAVGKTKIMEGDESQETAVDMSMGGSSVKIIHGSGGSGKTTVIEEIVRQYVEKGKRVLIVSQMNQAVDRAIKNMVNDASVPVLRMGNDPGAFNYGTRSVWINDEEALAEFKWRKEQGDKLSRKDRGVVFAATNIGIVTDKMGKTFLCEKDFDLIIMDESSKETLTGALVPIQYLKDNGTLVIVGDEKQLKPYKTREMVDGLKTLGLSDETINGFFRSILSRISGQNIADEVVLSTNWRSHPLIARMVSKLFYNGEIHPGGCEDFTPETISLRFEDTDSDDEEYHEELYEIDGRPSLINRRSAQKVVQAVAAWKKKGIKAKDITIVTPYAGQKKYLIGLLTSGGFTGDNMPEVVTINSYQGGENENIILDLVRSNDRGEIGFLKEMENLTVALSRARKNLLVMIDSRVFLKNIEDVHPDDRPAREVFLGLLEFYLDEIWQYYPDILPGNKVLQNKVKEYLGQEDTAGHPENVSGVPLLEDTGGEETPADHLMRIGRDEKLKSEGGFTEEEYAELIGSEVDQGIARAGLEINVSRGNLEKEKTGEGKDRYRLTPNGAKRVGVIGSVEEEADKRALELAKIVVTGLLNTALNNGGEPVLVAIDNNLSGAYLIKNIIKELADLKENGSLQNVMRNIEIIRAESEKLALEVGKHMAGEYGKKVKAENVIMLADIQAEAYCGSFKDRAVVTFVDSSMIGPGEHYYPIIELFYFTLARALHIKGVKDFDRSKLEEIFASVNGELDPNELITANTLKIHLKPAVKFEGDELAYLYKAIQRFLKAA